MCDCFPSFHNIHIKQRGLHSKQINYLVWWTNSSIPQVGPLLFKASPSEPQTQNKCKTTTHEQLHNALLSDPHFHHYICVGFLIISQIKFFPIYAKKATSEALNHQILFQGKLITLEPLRASKITMMWGFSFIMFWPIWFSQQNCNFWCSLYHLMI